MGQRLNPGWGWCSMARGARPSWGWRIACCALAAHPPSSNAQQQSNDVDANNVSLVGPCASSPCAHAVVCVDVVAAFECICEDGWQGSTCAQSAYWDSHIAVALPTDDHCLVITGVIDGVLPGGLPKAVELYATCTCSLGQYGIGVANDGGGTDGEEYQFSENAEGSAVAAGEFVYLAAYTSTSSSCSADGCFEEYFGFSADFITGNSNQAFNGNDAVELFYNGVLVDVFGEATYQPETDTDLPWDFTDRWVYRSSGSAANSTDFNLAEWTFGNILSEDTNVNVDNPMPVGTYSAGEASMPLHLAATVSAHSSATHELTIFNSGTTPLIVASIVSTVGWAQAAVSGIGGEEVPLGGLVIPVTFQGASTAGPGNYTGLLTISSNDLVHAETVIELSLVVEPSTAAVAVVSQPAHLEATVSPGSAQGILLTVWNTLHHSVKLAIEDCTCNATSVASLFQELPCHPQSAPWILLSNCSRTLDSLHSTQMVLQLAGPFVVDDYDFVLQLGTPATEAVPWPIVTSLHVRTSPDLFSAEHSYYSVRVHDAQLLGSFEVCSPFIVALHAQDSWGNTILEEINEACRLVITNTVGNGTERMLQWSYERSCLQVEYGVSRTDSFVLNVSIVESHTSVRPEVAVQNGTWDSPGMDTIVADSTPCEIEYPWGGNDDGTTCVSRACPMGYQFSALVATGCPSCAQTACDACVMCEPGQFSATGGLEQCHNCSAGRYCSTYQCDQCQVCEPGRVSESGATTCETCDYGKQPTASQNGSVHICQQCPVGKGGGSGGLCVDCSDNDFKVSSDESALIHECLACPEPAFTSHNATVHERCKCAAGYYSLHNASFSFALESSAAWLCRRCSELGERAIDMEILSAGEASMMEEPGVCLGGSVGAATICPIAGMWIYNISTEQLGLLPCEHGVGQCVETDASHCCPGCVGCPTDGPSVACPRSFRHQTGARCADFHTGYLCTLCVAGYDKVGGECVACDGVQWALIGGQIMMAFTLAIVIFGKSLVVVCPIEQAHIMFVEADADQNGTLDKDETTTLMLRMGHALAGRRIDKVMEEMTGSETVKVVTLEQFVRWCDANQPTASLSSLIFFVQTATMVGGRVGLLKIFEIFNLSLTEATGSCFAPRYVVNVRKLPLILELVPVIGLPMVAAVLISLIYRARSSLRTWLVDLHGHHFWRALVNLVLLSFAPVTRICMGLVVCTKGIYGPSGVDGLLALDGRVTCFQADHYLALVPAVVLLVTGLALPVVILLKAQPYFRDTQVGAWSEINYDGGKQGFRVLGISKALIHWDAVFSVVREDASFWPALMLFLKLIINGLIILGKGDKAYDYGVWLQLLLIVGAGLSYLAQPYRWPRDNTVQMCVFLSLAMLMGVTNARSSKHGTEHSVFEWVIMGLIALLTLGIVASTAIGRILAPLLAKREARAEYQAQAVRHTSNKTQAQRIHAAVSKLSAVRALHQPPPALPPSTRTIFEQIALDGDSITAGGLLGWWASHEPAELDTSRLPAMQAQFDAAGVDPDDALDYTDYEYVLAAMRSAEYTEHEDAFGKKYVVHTQSRKSHWALPTLNVWLHDLHKSAPLGLLYEESPSAELDTEFEFENPLPEPLPTLDLLPTLPRPSNSRVAEPRA